MLEMVEGVMTVPSPAGVMFIVPFDKWNRSPRVVGAETCAQALPSR